MLMVIRLMENEGEKADPASIHERVRVSAWSSGLTSNVRVEARFSNKYKDPSFPEDCGATKFATNFTIYL